MGAAGEDDAAETGRVGVRTDGPDLDRGAGDGVAGIGDVGRDEFAAAARQRAVAQSQRQPGMEERRERPGARSVADAKWPSASSAPDGSGSAAR